MSRILLCSVYALLFPLIFQTTSLFAQPLHNWTLQNDYIWDEVFPHYYADGTGQTFSIFSRVLQDELVIQKYDVNRNLLWEQVHPSAQWGISIRPVNCKKDNAGNLFLYCETNYTNIFNRDVLLIKLDPAGQVVWSKCVPTGGDDTPIDILPTPQGSLYALEANVANHGFKLNFYQPDGTLIWQLLFPSAYRPSAQPLSFDLNGDLVFIFSKLPTPNGAHTWEVHRIEPNGTDHQVFTRTVNDLTDQEPKIAAPDLFGDYFDVSYDVLTKTNNQGATLWSHSAQMTVESIIQDASGAIYLYGYVVAGGKEMRITKLTGQGTVLWDQTYASSNPHGMIASQLLITSNGNLYALAPQLSFPNTPPSSYSENYALYRLDPNTGSVLANAEFGWPGLYHGALSMTEDAHGNLLIQGDQRSNQTSNWNDYRFITQICAVGCEPNIVGQVYWDADRNCAVSVGDSPKPQRLIEVDNGQEYALSNQAGDYFLKLAHGPHTLSCSVPQYWEVGCQNGPVSVNVDTTNPTPVQLDFPIFPIPNIVDMRASVAVGPARPGFSQTHSILIENVGTTTRSGTVAYTLDQIFDYVSAIPSPDSISGSTLFWAYNSVAVGNSDTHLVTTSLPANIALLNNPYTTCVTVNPVAIDTTPGDNTACFSSLITGSYDPNDKTATPTILLPGERDMSYLVRFQNTGTDTAFTVIIRDTISELLDLETFQMGATSHPYTLELRPGRELVWTFENILLPDSNRNEPASHGFLQYSVQTIPDLPLFSEITNTAAIFFDFNPAVITNTTLTPYRPDPALRPQTGEPLQIFPNPTANSFRIDAALPNLAEYDLIITDLAGRIQHQQTGVYQNIPIELSAASFPAGVYLIRVNSQQQQWTGKLLRLGTSP